MISCQQADVLAAALSVGSIESSDQASLLQHLGSCAACRRMAGEYMTAAARLPLALEPVTPSPELRGRLMRAVYAEAEQARQHPSRVQRSTPWRRLWQALPAARGFTVLAGAAAVALVAVATWGATRQQHAAPATVAVALRATVVAPQAHGELTYQAGAHVAVLTATGLPSPASVTAGRAVYEVWLIRSNGSAVGEAFLTRDPDGTWTAALRADLGSYTAVALTPEPAGGSPTPTGARVIEGSLTS